MSSRNRRNVVVGLAFLAPNIAGFLAFTLVPLVFSLVLAFSNWDLKRHNMFKDEPIQFVAFDNFTRLISHPEFWRFLGNTLYLMMGIPFGIAGSLGLAMLLSKDIRGGSRRAWAWVLAASTFLAGIVMLTAIGFGGTAMVLLLSAVACAILLAGSAGGSMVYRTLFYLPHFTAGVATILLWKNLYNPNYGPINQALTPLLDRLARAVRTQPAGLFPSLTWLTIIALGLLTLFAISRLRRWWSNGDLGTGAALVGLGFVLLPIVLAPWWGPTRAASIFLPLMVGGGLAYVSLPLVKGRDFTAPGGEGAGSAMMVGAVFMIGEFLLLGLAMLLARLPAMAADGLDPPGWYTNYHWAKPSLMLMGFWAAIGSNNMLLYLAGLSGVPAELYEASDIDGAGHLAKFWHITWPQLAPTTFFIVVMSVIGGLQGGFEMARTMTRGGPDGATTTLSYFIYVEGFETGRLGYSSAVSWTLFVLVFAVTVFNWRFGNRYVND